MIYPHGAYSIKLQLYHIGNKKLDSVKLKYKESSLDSIDKLPALDVGGLTSIGTGEFSLDKNDSTKLYRIRKQSAIPSTDTDTIISFIRTVFGAGIIDAGEITQIADSLHTSLHKDYKIEKIELFHLETNIKYSKPFYQFIIPKTEILEKTAKYYIRNHSGTDDTYAIDITSREEEDGGELYLSFSIKDKSLDPSKETLANVYIAPNLNKNNIKYEYSDKLVLVTN